MNARTGNLLFVAVVVLAATLFVRLGVWQMDRRDERRAVNEAREERLEKPLLRMSATDVDGRPSPDEIAWRRVEIRGRWDYPREIVLRNRSHRGSPGVYVLTPLLIAEDADTLAVPVLRGWLPAADATHADLALGRPAGTPNGDGPDGSGPASDTVTVRGIALAGADERGGPVDTLKSAGGRHPVVSRPHVPTLREVLPYPATGFIVQADARSATRSLPRPVPVPELDAGPHLMYALQWFSFALIAVVGGGIFLWTRRRG